MFNVRCWTFIFQNNLELEPLNPLNPEQVQKRRLFMLNIIKKSMLTGIGLALIAKDEVEDLAKELVNKGKMSENEGTKFLEDLQKRYDQTQQKLEEKVQKAVKDFMKKADVVTGDELKGLKKEIRELKKAISKGTDES